MTIGEIAPKPTRAEYVGGGKMLVTSEKIEHSARECACYNNCGVMVRCGTYGKKGDVGIYGCPHCSEYGSNARDEDGNRKIHPSYADHKKHVLRNKKCLAAQGVDPSRLTPLKILGRGLETKPTTNKHEEVKYDKHGKKVSHRFFCPYPGCESTMRHSHRFTHMVETHDLSSLDFDKIKDDYMDIEHICQRHYRRMKAQGK